MCVIVTFLKTNVQVDTTLTLNNVQKIFKKKN